MNNQLSIYFQATNVNGFPTVRVWLDDQMLKDHSFSQTDEIINIPLSKIQQDRVLKIERYGKNSLNTVDAADQILEIIDIKVDGVPIPKFFIQEQSKFEFDNIIHPGSCYFGPNGTWSFTFKTPIITDILDNKILHEAKFNQDYEFPWSYKLGPHSVDKITTGIKTAMDRVLKIYE